MKRTAAWPLKHLPRAPWPRSAGRSDSRVSVNAAARLDRLPVSAFHRRILTLIGIGMFFAGHDLFVAPTLSRATPQSGLSPPPPKAPFFSATLIGPRPGLFPPRFPRA